MRRVKSNIIHNFFAGGYFLPVMALFIVIIMYVINSSGALEEGEEKIITTSSLMEAIDVSELSTSEFIYNGIAEVKNEKKEKVEYYIRYDARVRAGIDIKNIEFNINVDDKKIEVTLPQVEIFTPPSIDPNSLSYIPSDKEYDLQEVLETCEDDVLKEAKEANELKISATESLKTIIEALLRPIIEPEGYEIRWNQ